MSNSASKSASALVATLGVIRVEELVEACIDALNHAKHARGIVPLQEEREAKLFELFRCLYRMTPESFNAKVIDALKKISSSSIERHDPFDACKLPRDGDYIILKKAMLRIWRTANTFGFVGVDGTRYEYSPVEFEKDLGVHRAMLVAVRAVLEPIDLEISSNELAASLINELHQAKSSKLQENFLHTRRGLGLLGAELTPSNVNDHRVTHCYVCNRHLESDLFMECSACRWIVCVCGACGCGYDSAKSG